MKLIATKEQIQTALKQIAPQQICVAYVGADWRKFIDVKKLKEIVLSPTLGTNPKAVEEIAKEIEWDNVHFLEKLHSKFYIGSDGAAVGSFNLSNNGIGTRGLEETGVFVTDKTIIMQLQEEFQRLRALANIECPGSDAKLKKLHDLKELRKREIDNGTLDCEEDEQTLSQYNSQKCRDNVYIMWCDEEDPERDYSSIKKQDPDISTEEEFEEIAANWVNVLESDEIPQRSWVLVWTQTKEKIPSRSIKPVWLFVHQVFKNAILAKDDDKQKYTKLLVERKPSKEVFPLPKGIYQLPPRPFEITKNFVSAFQEALHSDVFSDFKDNRPNEDTPWATPTDQGRVSELLLEVERLMKKENA